MRFMTCRNDMCWILPGPIVGIKMDWMGGQCPVLGAAGWVMGD